MAASQPKTAKRCSHCNPAGYLELRRKESGELLVHRCPHRLELIVGIEEHLRAYRVQGKRGRAATGSRA